MPNARSDLGYVTAGVQELEAYLLSTQVYWPIGASAPPGEPAFPQLTLGGLLLAQARLSAHPLNPAQETKRVEVNAALQGLRLRWQAAWSKKAGREFHARLNLWRDFLQEVRAKPEEPAGERDRFRVEVRGRVMLALLKAETAVIPTAEVELLEALDKLLKSIFISGVFVWEAALQPAFPQQAHWYLYGSLKGS